MNDDQTEGDAKKYLSIWALPYGPSIFMNTIA